MAKKTLTFVLIVAILLTFAGSALSGMGKKGTVIWAHPWQDDSLKGNDTPCSDDSSFDHDFAYGSGAGLRDFVIKVINSIAVQLYIKSAMKGKDDWKCSLRNDGKSE